MPLHLASKVVVVAADKVSSSWTNGIGVHGLATFSPQALSAGAVARAVADDARHDVVRVRRARPITRSSGVRVTAPSVAAHVVVEANAVIPPVV